MARSNKNKRPFGRNQALLSALCFVVSAFLLVAAAPLVTALIGLGVDLESGDYAAVLTILKAFRIICFCWGMWILMWAFRFLISYFVPYASDVVKNKLAWGCFLVALTAILAPVTGDVARGIMTGRAQLSVNDCLMAFSWLCSLAMSLALLINGWKQARSQSQESAATDGITVV